jgi:hypothetical protein
VRRGTWLRAANITMREVHKSFRRAIGIRHYHATLSFGGNIVAELVKIEEEHCEV